MWLNHTERSDILELAIMPSKLLFAYDIISSGTSAHILVDFILKDEMIEYLAKESDSRYRILRLCLFLAWSIT